MMQFITHLVRTPLARCSLLLGAAILAAAGPQSASRTRLVVHRLASNGTVAGTIADANLVNPWGIATADGTVWVVNNGTGTISRLDAAGQEQGAAVDIQSTSDEPASPTGVVRNPRDEFVVSDGTTSAPATLIFATEDGTINALNAAGQTIVVVDNSLTGAIYKGITLARTRFGDRLYVTDFHNRRIDVFDGNFQPVTTTGQFIDRRIPADFAPFGIAEIDDRIYVSYARQDADAEDDVPGQGNGFIDVFNTDGQLLRRLVRRGKLNSPWAMTQAPENFGQFGNALLVGNFGNGQINAYDAHSGRFLGTLRNAQNRPISIDGLWGLAFADQANNSNNPILFFAAGPDDEQNGEFGTIRLQRPGRNR